MKYWAAKNKDGTIHLSNVKPIKPSDYYRGTDTYPNANDSVFWIYDEAPGGIFFVEWEQDIPGLTFENSPQEVELKLK
jgi:hypothetical protein